MNLTDNKLIILLLSPYTTHAHLELPKKFCTSSLTLIRKPFTPKIDVTEHLSISLSAMPGAKPFLQLFVFYSASTRTLSMHLLMEVRFPSESCASIPRLSRATTRSGTRSASPFSAVLNICWPRIQIRLLTSSQRSNRSPTGLVNGLLSCHRCRSY